MRPDTATHWGDDGKMIARIILDCKFPGFLMRTCTTELHGGHIFWWFGAESKSLDLWKMAETEYLITREHSFRGSSAVELLLAAGQSLAYCRSAAMMGSWWGFRVRRKILDIFLKMVPWWYLEYRIRTPNFQTVTFSMLAGNWIYLFIQISFYVEYLSGIWFFRGIFQSSKK